MYQCSLVLEGGGMRGSYTAGVLDFFMEKGLEFESVYGVSAGALNGANYLSGQKGRSIRTFTEYLGDKRYSGVKYLLKTGDLFNIDFVYNQIPNCLDPVDYEAFKNSKTKFYRVLSNVKTGSAEYIRITDLNRQMDILRRSASLPLLSNMVEIEGKKYLDGGICDSIPLRKSIEDGNKKNVVILTQHRGFEKKPSGSNKFAKVMYKKYPKFVHAMEYRHLMYNNQTKYVYAKEKEGDTFVIQPRHPVEIARLEKDPEKLKLLYYKGWHDREDCMEKLTEFLNK